jgi:hypothetical protein
LQWSWNSWSFCNISCSIFFAGLLHCLLPWGLEKWHDASQERHPYQVETAIIKRFVVKKELLWENWLLWRWDFSMYRWKVCASRAWPHRGILRVAIFQFRMHVKQGVLQPVRGQARMQIPVMLIRYVLCMCVPFPHTAVLVPIHHANVILCHSLRLMEQKSVIIFVLSSSKEWGPDWYWLSVTVEGRSVVSFSHGPLTVQVVICSSCKVGIWRIDV